MSRTFVIGDIHGAYRALRQCLDRSGFDYNNDHLICLGDVCDGWPETRESINELLKIGNLTYILGNHDQWALLWMKTGEIINGWLAQGGEATVRSYPSGVPEEHLQFLTAALPYYLLNHCLFVHAGIEPLMPLEQQGLDTFLWDRNLALKALELYEKNITGKKLTQYDEVYIGHTPTSFDKPVNAGDVWLMDTGAGWEGVLSIMEINTKEIFTSDPVPALYPGERGRGSK
jgi:serine/threonine protein phosphatase 1